MEMLEEQIESQEMRTVVKEDDTDGIVIEETEIVDCDESIRDEDLPSFHENLAYRVVQINGTTAASEIEVPVSQQGTNTMQVLTTPINGQFYVIGNANDVFTTANTSTRSLAPRTTTLQIESPRSSGGGLKKRDDRRRATHNEVERRRRDKINNWIAKLGKIIPECNNPSNGSANGSGGEGKASYETQSKGGILAKACEYITELRTENQKAEQYVKENEILRQEVHSLKSMVAQLKRENMQLKNPNVTLITAKAECLSDDYLEQVFINADVVEPVNKIELLQEESGENVR